MKTLIFLFCLGIPYFALSQSTPTVIEPGTRATEALAKVEKGYTTAEGWTIKPGDQLTLGHGSMPNKTFSFIYQSPIGYFSETSMDNYSNKRYAPTTMAGKTAKVKSVLVIGKRKTGYTVIAKVGLGEMVNYWIEIDNAIEAKELIPPAEYAKKELNTPPQNSVADEIKKLKELLDSGAITQEEYDAQKKKLLAN